MTSSSRSDLVIGHISTVAAASSPPWSGNITVTAASLTPEATWFDVTPSLGALGASVGTDVTFDGAGNKLDIATTGVYSFTFSATYARSGGTGVRQFNFGLGVNGADPTFVLTSASSDGNDDVASSGVTNISLTSGDEVRVMVQEIQPGGSSTMRDLLIQLLNLRTTFN